MRSGLICLLVVVTCGCGTAREAAPALENLVFLAGDGCPCAATMRANLDTALNSLGLRRACQFVDVDTRPDGDPRVGYGIPTVLLATALGL